MSENRSDDQRRDGYFNQSPQEALDHPSLILERIKTGFRLGLTMR
jgi:hypothetical protein